MTLFEKATPNPKALSFTLPGPVLAAADFASITRNDPAALQAALPAAQSVFAWANAAGQPVGHIFIGRDSDGSQYLTLTKVAHGWSDADKQTVKGIITAALAAPSGFVDEAVLTQHQKQDAYAPTDVKGRVVKAFFDRGVRPKLLMDGGGGEIMDVRADDGKSVDIYLRLEGACIGCPSSTTTTLRAFRDAVRAEMESDRFQAHVPGGRFGRIFLAQPHAQGTFAEANLDSI